MKSPLNPTSLRSTCQLALAALSPSSRSFVSRLTSLEMVNSARKGKQKAVSYAEVDSDVDMQWEDRQVQARKGESPL